MIKILDSEIEFDQASELGRDHFAECGMSGAYNKATVFEFLKSKSGIAMGLFESQKLIGYVLGSIFNHFYTGDKECGIFCWYVIPEKRGGLESIKLLKAYEKFVLDSGAKRIYAGCMNSDRGNQFASVFQRNGYREYETHFIKEA